MGSCDDSEKIRRTALLSEKLWSCDAFPWWCRQCEGTLCFANVCSESIFRRMDFNLVIVEATIWIREPGDIDLRLASLASLRIWTGRPLKTPHRKPHTSSVLEYKHFFPACCIRKHFKSPFNHNQLKLSLLQRKICLQGTLYVLSIEHTETVKFQSLCWNIFNVHCHNLLHQPEQIFKLRWRFSPW